MRERLFRTVLALLAVFAAVFAFRWTVRTALTRVYKAESAVKPGEIAVEPAAKVHDLARLVPKGLEVNIAGLSVRRRAERMHMPYSLAVDVAEQKALSAGWERLDDENAFEIKNISGMERVYRTPEGSIVLREVRAVVGDDSLMEDFVIPTELIPTKGETATPDILARRAARHVKEMMPGVLRDVVVGSPLLTELIERGNGAAFIVHCVAEMSADAAEKAIAAAAGKAGWSEVAVEPATAGGAATGASSLRRHAARSCWTKQNLTMHFEALSRNGLSLRSGTSLAVDFPGCDVNYRFTDDESYISKERKGK